MSAIVKKAGSILGLWRLYGDADLEAAENEKCWPTPKRPLGPAFLQALEKEGKDNLSACSFHAQAW